MKKLIYFVVVIAMLAGSPCAMAQEGSESKSAPKTTKEYLKKTTKDHLNETTKEYVKKKVKEQVEKKGQELINIAYKKYPIISKFTYSKGFTEMMNDYKYYDDVVGKLTTLNTALTQIAGGDSSGAAYTVTKEIINNVFPPAKYVFQFAEAWNKMLTSVSDAVREQNLDYIRQEYFKNVLPKCKDTCPREVEIAFANNMAERLGEGGEYGLVAWVCKEGLDSGKLAGICVSGPFDYTKHRSFINAPGGEKYAVYSFIRMDQKIQQAVSVRYQLLQAIEDVGEMKKAIGLAAEYVKKNLAIFENQQEKILTEKEVLKQEQQRAATEKLPVAKFPDKCDEGCSKQYNAAYEKFKAVGLQIEEKRKEINLKTKALLNEKWAKQNELKHYTISGEMKSDPGTPAIDEDNVDFNGKQAENLDKHIANAEKWLQVEQMQVKIYDEQISGLQGLSGLYSQQQSLDTQYGAGFYYYRYRRENTVNYSLILENEIKGVELQRQELLDEINLVQSNLSKYKTIQNRYQTAFDEGTKKAKEVFEKEVEPAYKEYEETDREFESVENEIRTYEQEKLVQINGVMAKIRNAKNQSEVDEILPRVSKDMAEYNKLLQKQKQLAEKLNEKRQNISAVSRSSRIQRAQSTIGYNTNKFGSMSSRKVKTDLSGSRFSLSEYLKYISEANRYVVKTCAEYYDSALKKLSDESKILVMPDSDLKQITSEVYSSTGEGAVQSIKGKAASIAKLKDFQGAYNAYMADIGSSSSGKWNIEGVLSEEATGALHKLASFRDMYLYPLLKKRSLKMKEDIIFVGPKIGRSLEPVHGNVQLTAQDIKDGFVPVQFTATSWGIAGARVKVSMEGKDLPVKIETSTTDDIPDATFTSMIPVRGEGKINISYSAWQSGRQQWIYSLELSVPPMTLVAPQDITKEVQNFYKKFKNAYESKNDSVVMSLISDQWESGDGTTIAHLSKSLRNSFSIFNQIKYAISNLQVTKKQEGYYTASYDLIITGRNYELNLKHEEKSKINEELKVDEGGIVKLYRTLSGKFWQKQ